MLKAVEIKWDVTDNEMDDEACEILESLPTEMIIPERHAYWFDSSEKIIF